MGAEQFVTLAPGVTAEDAFTLAVDRAHYDYGHRGYTGTIAEKDEFVVIESMPVSPQTAKALAQSLIDAADPRIDDKWGPAGAIAVQQDPNGSGTDAWLFFGWASS